MSGKRIILNSILTILAIFLFGTAACLTWLPSAVLPQKDSSHSNQPSPVALNQTEETRTQPSDIRLDTVSSKSDIITVEASASQAPTAAETYIPPKKSLRLNASSPEKMLRNHPFRDEAAKMLSGRLEEDDSLRRRTILNYCEHFRMAYDSKDIDFLRQIFSDEALIIVGHTVRTGPDHSELGAAGKVRFNIRSKREYLDRLSEIFRTNKKVKVKFSDFRILRHPAVDGIYGVSLRQKYDSDVYSDEGYVFLLWDFRNESMPLIHVRTWQPANSVPPGDDPIGMGDFNLD